MARKVRITAEVADEAKALAVRYNAYQEAVAAKDWKVAAVWGAMLAETQAFFGLELITHDRVASLRTLSAEAAKAA